MITKIQTVAVNDRTYERSRFSSCLYPNSLRRFSPASISIFLDEDSWEENSVSGTYTRKKQRTELSQPEIERNKECCFPYTSILLSIARD